MLLALAVPDNPLNLVARLATGTAGSEQWLILALVGLVVIFLALLTQWAAQWAAKKTLAG
jgi:ABC-2 type transport system permease protein